MGLADHVAPVAAADGDDGQLGGGDGALDGVGNLLAALDAEAEVAVRVADDDKGLEARALAGRRLLLDGHDLEHLVLERRAQEVVEDLGLLDGERVQVDVLEVLDLAVLHEAAELGEGLPLLALAVVAATAAAAATATVATAAAVATTATAKAATVTAATAATPTGRCRVRHLVV